MEKTTIMLDDEETRLLAVLSTKEPGTEEYKKVLENAECVHSMKIKADESEIKNGLEIQKDEREENESKWKKLGAIAGWVIAGVTAIGEGVKIYIDRKKWVEMCMFEN